MSATVRRPCAKSFKTSERPLARSLIKGSWGRLELLASKAMLLPGWELEGRKEAEWCAVWQYRCSQWCSPKGQFWAPILFVIYINDLELGLSSKVYMLLIRNLQEPCNGTLQPLEKGPLLGRCPLTWISAMSCTWASVQSVQAENYSLVGSEIYSVNGEKTKGLSRRTLRALRSA